MKTWIKFCGNTSIDDALAAIDAGADALGFIFAPSKRQINPQQAEAILGKVPRQIERIGVFVEEPTEKIRRLLMDLDLTGIQLHGWDMPLELWSYLPKARRDSLRIIKSVIVQNGWEPLLTAWIETASDVVNTWLIDSGAGSGKTFDWQTARTQLGDRRAPFIIAGGLNPENVGEAMKIFTPWGVDVVSGIEREPGRKDPEKMRAFVAAVRKAEQQ